MRILQQTLQIDKVAAELALRTDRPPLSEFGAEFIGRLLRACQGKCPPKEACLFFAQLWYYLPLSTSAELGDFAAQFFAVITKLRWADLAGYDSLVLIVFILIDYLLGRGLCKDGLERFLSFVVEHILDGHILAIQNYDV